MPGMPRRRPLPLGARTLLLATLLALSSGCAGAGAAQPAGAPQGAGSGAGSAGSGGSGAAGTARAIPPATGSSSAPAGAPSPSGGADCAAPPATIAIVPGHEPAPVCLRVGDTLTITAPPSAAQPWQPMKTSDAAVLACASRQEDQGALTAVCHALRPGAVIVSTMTAPFAGDPHGPAQFMWTLTIHVLPGT
jgi:hypothetical protein